MHGHSVVTVEPSDAAGADGHRAVLDTRSGEVRFRGIHFCRGCTSEAALSLRETVEIVDEIVRMEATSD